MALQKRLDEIRALEGKRIEVSLEIDQHMINLYCQCLEDNNPKWKETAPPGLVLTPMISESAVPLGIPEPFPPAVDASVEGVMQSNPRIGDATRS